MLIGCNKNAHACAEQALDSSHFPTENGECNSCITQHIAHCKSCLGWLNSLHDLISANEISDIPGIRAIHQAVALASATD